MQDLSQLAEDSMWPTSQAAGNRQSMPDKAMTAPGSPPVDRELQAAQMADPQVSYSGPRIPVGADGKPQPGTAWNPGTPSWKPTTIPEVIRD